MKLLVLSDLHYNNGNNSRAYNLLKALNGINENPDALVLCGDNAEISDGFQNHFELFDALKKRFPIPTGFIIGNHELWGKERGINARVLLDAIYPDLAKEFDMTYLEQTNMSVNSHVVAGTYGHYDYTLGDPKIFTKQEIETGIPVVAAEEEQFTAWDKRLIDWQGLTDTKVCSSLVNRLDERLADANKPLITISHTLPRRTLSGRHEQGRREEYLKLFNGSKLIDQVIINRKPNYHFCGHTHAYAITGIGTTVAVNVGSSNNIFSYLTVDTERGKIDRQSINLE